MEVGGNFSYSISWCARTLEAAGFEVELVRTGRNALDLFRRIERGEADITVSLECGAWMGANGMGVYGGEVLPVRGLALCEHPGHYVFNMVRADLGLRSFTDIAEQRPKLSLNVAPEAFFMGRVAQMMFRYYGIELYSDIVAWGGELHHNYRQAGKDLVDGRVNGLFRENTRYGPSLIGATAHEMVYFPLEPDLAHQLKAECGTPVVTLEAGWLPGLTEPVLTVDGTAYPLLVHADMDAGLVYRLAKSLNESSETHAISPDIFYSPLHAPRTGAPLHRGAERYYREIGTLK